MGRHAGWFRVAWHAALAGLAFVLATARPLHAQPAGDTAPLAALHGSDAAPLTVVASRFVHAGCAATFEALVHATFDQAEEVAGHPGADVLRPADPSGEPYNLILHFDSAADYRQWLASPERTAWLEHSGQLTHGAVQDQYRSGLEVWVTVPDQPGYNPPDPVKTMAVNWIAIYPATMVMYTALTPVTAGWPTAASIALRTGLMVSVVHYGVMPFLGRIFRDWLYPPPAACQE